MEGHWEGHYARWDQYYESVYYKGQFISPLHLLPYYDVAQRTSPDATTVSVGFPLSRTMS